MHNFSLSCRAFSSKKGFALIVTLSVLALISALAAVLIGYLDMAREDASRTKALVQANLFFSDLKELLVKQKNTKALYNALYSSAVPLRSEDGGFLLVLHCVPLNNGVNINWLAYDGNVTMTKQYTVAAKVFDYLVENYNVRNPARLEELLLEATGKNVSGNTDGQSRFSQKNGMISHRQFRQILDRYRFEEDDREVEAVPWEKYFVFNQVDGDAKRNKMEGDYLSMELLSLLFDVDIERLKEEWTPVHGALKKFLKENAITYDKGLFFNNTAGQSYCEVDYTYEGQRYRFAFEDHEGEVNGFEFYGER